MSIISRIFGKKKKNKYDDKPPMHGGDGLSKHSPVIVNCASMGMAQSLIDDFITDKCGKGWVRGMEYTIGAPDNPEKLLRMISVESNDGSEYSFYFDLARPVAAAAKMLGI
ncbi:MAG: hypothetical protein HOC92_10440, partial [Gammaproteobacteria bacterium]|jgi:hypothetical protein|nr:hypothetical protein [Gammaproteobacteria bacterium]